MKQAVAAVAGAFQFLTLAPPLIRRPFTMGELGRSVGYYPLVGAVLGLILAALSWGLGFFFSPLLVAALVLASWIGLTGALHFDGFLDTCDGLFGGRTPEKRMEIMRDHRVGAYAVAGGGALLLIKFSTLAGSIDLVPALILAPTLGRWAMSMAIVLFPYGREAGLGRAMKDQAGQRDLILATAITALVALLSGHVLSAIAWLAAILVLFVVARFTLGRIPGLTGDIYGTLCELTEVAVLLVFAASWPM
ncbi:MAG: adenosylcobinamide-GDP ribazoletransferase [Chloroflexi bacterium]|nr:adenosylcobinamide-GDP ribazoletransferase [Chloroflexota bacterium]